jgi:oxygen-independent coproporphyrinogen-3 oxidase
MPERIEPWLGALALEAQRRAGSFPAFDTLYLGGGTPSALDPTTLCRLFELLHARFTLLPGAEITVEVNPSDASRELLVTLRGLGVNRLSLGIQALDDRVLGVLGRRHDAATAKAAALRARAVGSAAISLDLIYGVPGQSRRSWLATLAQAVAWEPEHLSCYMLTREPDTPLAAAMAAGKLRPCSEEVLARRFRETSAMLQAAGYVHDEVSSFSRGPRHRARHNGKYWRRVPYLGLGPAAHSFSGVERWWNVASVAAYVKQLGAGQTPVEGSERLTASDAALEALVLGLRTAEGISRALVAGQPRRVEALIARGWLGRQGARLAPTPEGMLFADRMALELSLDSEPGASD